VEPQWSHGSVVVLPLGKCPAIQDQLLHVPARAGLQRLLRQPQSGGLADAAVGYPAETVSIAELSAWHSEKRDVWSGDFTVRTRTINAVFADGHVKVYRMDAQSPAWNPNFDFNWLQFPGTTAIPPGGNYTCDFGLGKDTR